MKRYLVFCGDDYYPKGGWADFASARDTGEEARSVAVELLASRALPYDTAGAWAQVADAETGLLVAFLRRNGRRGVPEDDITALKEWLEESRSARRRARG